MRCWLILSALSSLSIVLPKHEQVSKNWIKQERMTLCKFFLGLSKKIIMTPASKDTIALLCNKTCVLLGYDEMLCDNMVKTMKDIFMKVLSEGILNPEHCDGRGIYEKWNVTIRSKELDNRDDEHSTQLKKPIGKFFRIIQITDVHVDLSYKEGMESQCSLPLCCDTTSTRGKVKSPASKIGEYRCDTSPYLFDSAIEYIKSFKDVEIMYFTGDMGSHRSWLQTKDTQTKMIDFIRTTFMNNLSHLKIVSALGNHETYPIDEYPSNRIKNIFDIQWLYDSFYQFLNSTLKEKVPETAKKAAFYSVVVKDNLKIISLNSNFGYKFNFVLLISNVDPFDQIQWLADELYESEKLSQKVHLIFHQSPGISQIPSWSDNLDQVLERFKDTVAGIFTGHCHTKGFYIQLDRKTRTIPQNIVHAAPSLTPLSGSNPSIVVYTIDSETKRVVDSELHYVDLIDAKKKSKIEWKILGNDKDVYMLKDSSPQAYYDSILNVYKNSTYLEKWIWYSLSAAKPYIKPVENKKNYLCRYLITQDNDYRACKIFD